jgi:hypothetical protein
MYFLGGAAVAHWGAAGPQRKNGEYEKINERGPRFAPHHPGQPL